MTKNQQKRSVLIVAVVVAIILAVRWSSFILPRDTGRVDPHINLVEDRGRQIADRQRQQQIAAFVAVTEGEVFRTEERLREATALATATSVFAANESLNRRIPASVTALLIGVNNAGLLPPGMQLMGSEGEVSCPRGKLFVRYRPEPIGIEVLSLGKLPLDGPALLIRVPADGFSATNNEGASLYVATSIGSTNLPTPFAHEAEVVALGFAPEPLRAAKLPKP
jgi:hypothetical protein